MREIDLEELKRLQLDILKALCNFCSERGLAFSISNGTLIGAVRHGGYIPWDDDLDVSMPRSDYERLMVEFPMVIGGHYRLASLERNPSWDRFYAKIYDDRTVMKENRRDAVEIGVNVDIFPVDEAPADDADWNAWRRRRLFIHSVYEAKDRTLLSPRAWWKTLILVPLKLMLLPVSKRFLCLKAEREAQRWNGCGSGMAVSLVSGFSLTQRYPMSVYGSFRDISFEGYQCSCIEDYDSYLRAGYGDYMTLPPEEKRSTHHKFKAFYKD